MTATVRLWIWARGWLNVVPTVLHRRSQNLTANMCLHHPHFLIFLSFQCNIVVINIKFKFTYSKGWQLVSVIVRNQLLGMTTDFCHYLFTAYLFLFQCQLDAQYNLQQAFLKQYIFQKTLWLPFYSLLWAYPLETSILFEFEADNHQVCGHS